MVHIHYTCYVVIQQNETDEDENQQTKMMRSDQLWTMLFTVNVTPTLKHEEVNFFLLFDSTGWLKSFESDTL